MPANNYLLRRSRISPSWISILPTAQDSTCDVRQRDISPDDRRMSPAVDVGNTIAALRGGAYDSSESCAGRELRVTLRNATETTSSGARSIRSDRTASRFLIFRVIGSSPAMKKALDLAIRVASWMLFDNF